MPVVIVKSAIYTAGYSASWTFPTLHTPLSLSRYRSPASFWGLLVNHFTAQQLWIEQKPGYNFKHWPQHSREQRHDKTTTNLPRLGRGETTKGRRLKDALFSTIHTHTPSPPLVPKYTLPVAERGRKQNRTALGRWLDAEIVTKQAKKDRTPECAVPDVLPHLSISADTLGKFTIVLLLWV